MNIQKVASENWDDDFEFQQNTNKTHTTTTTTTTTTKNATNATTATTPGNDVFTTPSRVSTNTAEDWDAEIGDKVIPLEDKLNYDQWHDPGPSSPSKRRSVPSPTETENWDDDYEDSPVRKSTTSSSKRRTTPSRFRQTWDDDDDDDDHHQPPTQPDSPTSKRTRQNAYSSSSSDDDDELGFADKEDRTVTARSRKAFATRHSPPPPPVPPLPFNFGREPVGEPAPFPRSPTASVFSMPASTTTGRDSVAFYSSTTHLGPNLRKTSGSSKTNPLAALPPSPPIHRERRRLRKKSRPPHLDGDVFELEDRQSLEIPPIPSTPSPTPPAPQSLPTPPEQASSPNSNKSGVLSRIGSVKRKWNVRKKRASTGPAEVVLNEETSGNDATPRPPSQSSYAHPSPPHPKTGWFFRASGGVGGANNTSSSSSSPPDLKHKSSSGIRTSTPSPSSVGAATTNTTSSIPDTPTKIVKRKSAGGFALLGQRGSREDMGATPRRPVSMQVPAGGKLPLPVPSGASRVVSYNGTDSAKESGGEEGGRSFLGGVRRLSFGPGAVRRHRRAKSKGSTVDVSPPELDQLLPPIELSPPSPPLTAPPFHLSTKSLLLPTSTSEFSTPASALISSPARSIIKSALQGSSPQSASLGRSSQPPPGGVGAAVLRRNSLGDLKIPSRIIQAQSGLRRDLGMVREFAANVEHLKELQVTYHSLISQVQTILDSNQSQPRPRATSPTFFNLPRSRSRSNTNPLPLQQQQRHLSKQFASSFNSIDSKYRVSWECAELLIELGGGTPVVSSSVSAPAVTASHRERAITLAGDENKPKPPLPPPPPVVVGPPIASPPPNLAWRASTGRHDLSHRQLVLLKEILDHPTQDAITRISEEESVVNREWRWGDAMNSTVTLQSEYEESSPVDGEGGDGKKRARRSRMGMRGLRDMLRGLKRNHTEPIIPSATPPLPSSSASLSTDSSSSGNHRYTHPRLPAQQQQQKRKKTSIGPEDTASPYNATSLTAPYKSSPRRPSLASIFRIGQKHKASATTSSDASADSINNIQAAADTSGSTSMEEEEDWDQMDSASDLDAAGQGLGVGVDASTTTTVKGRGKSPYLQENGHELVAPSKKTVTATDNPSRSSIWGEPSQLLRNTRLSNVEESVLDESAASKAKAKSRASPRRPISRKGNRVIPAGHQLLPKSGSVRSAPPTSSSSLPDPKLAMTPENIKPLLENSRQVQKRLTECIREMRALLAVKPT